MSVTTHRARNAPAHEALWLHYVEAKSSLHALKIASDVSSERNVPDESPERNEPVARLFLRASRTSFEISRADEGEVFHTSRIDDFKFYYHLNLLINPAKDMDLEVESYLDAMRTSYLKHPLAKQVIKDHVQLINFLQELFSADLLDGVEKTLDLARGSTLGIEYVYRGTFGSYALKLFDYACILARALSVVSCSIVDDKEWKTVGPRRRRMKNSGGGEQRKDGSSSLAGKGGRGVSGGWGQVGAGASGGGDQGDIGGRGRGGGGGRGGLGGGRGGGSEPGPGGEGENEFSAMPIQLISVPIFVSPERPVPETTIRERLDRRDTVRGWAETFVADSLLSDFGVENTYFYKLDDPEDKDRTVAIFHGTRRSHLMSFCDLGIRPSPSNKEFSTGEAFYCTNYMQVAYEHAILNQPGNSWWFHPDRIEKPELGLQLDSVVVFAFSVITDVLQGYLPPASGEVPFKTYWFPTADKEWEDFCLTNMKGQKCRDEYDIIFGPLCITAWKVEERKVSDDNSEGSLKKEREKIKFINSSVKVDGQEVAQIAFVSRRSQLWLQKHLTSIFMEQRE